MNSITSVDISKLNITINNNNVNISVTDIPIISDTTMEIFKTFGTDSSTKLTNNLQEKATTLNHSIQKLQQAKDEDTRNKIFTTLRSALTVAVLVGGILGTIAMAWCPPAAIGIGIATFIAYTALCCYNANRIDLDLGTGNYADPLIAWIGGLFFPLYEGFGKVSRLEDQIQTQKKEIEANFTTLVSFFGYDRSTLEQALTQEVENLRVSLEGLKQLPSSTAAGEKEIQEKLQKHEKALSELTRAKLFYPQFQASV